MNMKRAALDLQNGLGLPASVATVLMWRGPDFTGLKVWLDPTYQGSLPEIPSTFEGYRVRVERRPAIVAH